MGLFLYLIAQIVTPIFNIFGLITIFLKPKIVRQKVLKDLAIAKDQTSNVYVQFYFNLFMLKKTSSDLFGNPDETISSVFGKNKRSGKLTKFGNFWANWLNKIDPGHVENAIEDDETKKNHYI